MFFFLEILWYVLFIIEYESKMSEALEMKFVCLYDETADTENTTIIMFAWVYVVEKTVLFIQTETHRIFFI